MRPLHPRPPREVDVLVIGAGQAGLGTAYWLRRTPAVRVLVVDATPVGRSWLERWDSLTLFTPRRFSSLPGLRFPDGPGRTPSRTEMAGYLQSYAQRFDLPVETGVRVQRLTQQRCGFVAWTSTGPVHAAQVVIATGPFHRPNIPAAGRGLDPAVTQLHSYDYRSPADIPSGPVLVVGGGNSAAQLALELAATHPVTIASPGPPWFLPEDFLGVSMYWWMLLTGVLNAASSARVSRYIRRRGDAIVGRQLRQLIRGGHVRLHPHRVVSAEGRQVRLADGSSLTVSSVLWCTGYRPDMSWIQVAGATDSAGAPVHHDGASPVPGLHWMGLPWQTRLNSSIMQALAEDQTQLWGQYAAALLSEHGDHLPPLPLHDPLAAAVLIDPTVATLEHRTVAVSTSNDDLRGQLHAARNGDPNAATVEVATAVDHSRFLSSLLDSLVPVGRDS